MEQAIYVCGIIAAFGGALGAIFKWLVQPLNEIKDGMKQIERIDANQKVLMKSTASMMEHIITGNHVEKLKDDYDKMIEHIIEN